MIRPRVRTLLHFAGTAAAVGALALEVPGLASAQTSGGTWAGYVADSTTYTSVSATATTKDVFTLAIKNTTKGWSKSSQSTDTSAKRASAEVVLEVPASSGVLPIASGTVTYTDAKVDGANLGAADPTEFNGSAASCGALVGGTKFTCTWQ